tara:strand:+ start:96 stop:884 length:789 start_codon:yes stop_codon:yes gene_type:complete
MLMRKLVLSLLLVGHLQIPPFALCQAELHDWKNKTGQAIQAKFISGDASGVVLFLNGRNYFYKLSDLSEESQALARRLTAAQDTTTENPPRTAGSALPKGNEEAIYSPAEIKRALDEHNRLRREVGVPPLKWDPELAKHAWEWANVMAQKNFFEHSKGDNEEGENIAYTKGHTRSESIDIALRGWGEEEKIIYLSKGEPPVGGRGFGEVGHYTQMVWHETTHVGMATVMGRGGRLYTCARYLPSGNTVGERPYPKSVRKPRR